MSKPRTTIRDSPKFPSWCGHYFTPSSLCLVSLLSGSTVPLDTEGAEPAVHCSFGTYENVSLLVLFKIRRKNGHIVRDYIIMDPAWITLIFILTQCKMQHPCFSWRRGPWRPMSTGAVKSQGGPASTPPLVSLVSFLLNGHFFSETPPISSQFMGSPAFFPYHSSISLLLWLQRRTCQRTVNWIDPAGSDCRVLSRTHPDTVLQISGFLSQDVPPRCLLPSGVHPLGSPSLLDSDFFTHMEFHV